MGETVAIAQAVSALLPIVNTGVEHLIAWITTVRAAARQTGEWTPEADAAFRASLLATGKDPAYIIRD